MERLLLVVILVLLYDSLSEAAYKQLNVVNFETGNGWLLNACLVVIACTAVSIMFTLYVNDPYRSIEYWSVTGAFNMLSMAMLTLVFLGKKAVSVSRSIIIASFCFFCLGLLSSLLAK